MNIASLGQTVSVYVDAGQLAQTVARRIAELAAQAIAARGVFYIALAGGNTPRRCYQALCHHDINWQRVHVYFGDERCLPIGDPDRNDSMVRASLLDRIDIPSANIHCIPAELGAEQAAAQYAAMLPPILDVVMLGMGEDGHTASLFPDNSAAQSGLPVVPVYASPKPPAQRVSLGMTTLNAARTKLFLVSGEAKRTALARILRGIPLPAARIFNAEWHLDRAALPIINEQENELCK